MFHFDSLTNKELDRILTTIDTLAEIQAQLTDNHVADGDEVDLDELGTAVVEELLRRADYDAAWKLGGLMASGSIKPEIRPDGEVGYNFVDDEPLGTHGDADWEL